MFKTIEGDCEMSECSTSESHPKYVCYMIDFGSELQLINPEGSSICESHEPTG